MWEIEDAYLLHLRAVIREFARVYDRSIGTVCRASPARDAGFLDRLEAGAGLTFRRYDLMIEYFARHWPDVPGAVWPKMPRLHHRHPDDFRIDIIPLPTPRERRPEDRVVVKQPQFGRSSQEDRFHGTRRADQVALRGRRAVNEARAKLREEMRLRGEAAKAERKAARERARAEKRKKAKGRGKR